MLGRCSFEVGGRGGYRYRPDPRQGAVHGQDFLFPTRVFDATFGDAPFLRALERIYDALFKLHITDYGFELRKPQKEYHVFSWGADIKDGEAKNLWFWEVIDGLALSCGMPSFGKDNSIV